VLVQLRRDKAAALRLMSKLLKKLGFAPKVLVTDKRRSYGAAGRKLRLSARRTSSTWWPRTRSSLTMMPKYPLKRIASRSTARPASGWRMSRAIPITTPTRAMSFHLSAGLRRIAVNWRKDTLSITHFDLDHAVGRPHEIAQDGERWQFVRRTVGERACYELRRPSSAQAEVAPPAEDHAGGDAMGDGKPVPR